MRVILLSSGFDRISFYRRFLLLSLNKSYCRFSHYDSEESSLYEYNKYCNVLFVLEWKSCT